MTSIAAAALLLANRLIPRPALPGEAAPLDYARWEYETAGALLDLWDSCTGPPPQKIVDLGCGLGGKTHRLAEHVALRGEADPTWIGVDISLDHLTKAEAYHRSVGMDDVLKIAADGGYLPLGGQSIDRILSADTLEHLPDPRRMLREVHRVLRPGGEFVLLFNPWGSPRGSHLGDLVHLPWAHLLAPSSALMECAHEEGERRARKYPAEAESQRAFAASLIDHFENHVHRTSIGDLRRWVREGDLFEIGREEHHGPGPLRGWKGPILPGLEEVLSATYGVILRRKSSE